MSHISTRHLDLLPDVDGLKSLLQSLAVLDAIMSPEWESRYYSFNSKWSRHEQMGSMRNGCGDDFFALFNRAGCFLKGFAHEYPMSPYRTSPPEIWPGVLLGVPEEFSAALSEPAFSMADTTFCIWRRYTDHAWSQGPVDFPEEDDPDGSEFLLAMLDGAPETYRNFAEEYFERTVAPDAIRHVYSHRPLTDAVVKAINAGASVKALRADLEEIGYPVTGSVSEGG